MQIIRNMPHNFPHLKLARWLVVAVFLALAAGAGALFPLVGAAKATTALACGIGNTPTMDADGTPALQLPLPPNHNLSGNLPIGVLEPQYAVGQTITFSEDLSNVLNPPPLAGLQYQWSLGDGTQVVGLTVQHVYTKAGTYNVYSSVYSDGWQSFDSAQIVVVPQLLSDPPVAKLSASTDVIGPLGKITFSAGGSHALDGSKLTYQWNFNDGNTAATPVATHEFPNLPGKWIVGLTVIDARGARSFAVVHIQILNFDQLPSASLTASLTTIGTGNTVTFDASGSTPPTAPGTPAGDQIVKYVWNFGDGTPQVSSSAPTITHRFNRSGKFSVTVEAIDETGAPGTKSVTITVVALAASAGTPPGILYGGGALLVVLLALAGYIVYTNQRRRLALEREREAAMQRERLRRLRPGVSGRPQGYRPSPPPAGVTARQQGYRPPPPPPSLPSAGRLPRKDQAPSRPRPGDFGSPGDR